MISKQCPTLANVLPTYELVISSIEEILIETGKGYNDRVYNAFAEGKKKILKYWKMTDDSLLYSIAVGNLYSSFCCIETSRLTWIVLDPRVNLSFFQRFQDDFTPELIQQIRIDMNSIYTSRYGPL